MTSANFAVLINGIPSDFFPASRGIRQCCPLSPLLFILVIEGLSLLIADARNNGLIRGIQISSTLALTHLLFVDDVIVMGHGSLREWAAFEVILDSFCLASSISISLDKSVLLHHNIPDSELLSLTSTIPYKLSPITQGLSYLGFFIKPLSYKTRD